MTTINLAEHDAIVTGLQVASRINIQRLTDDLNEVIREQVDEIKTIESQHHARNVLLLTTVNSLKSAKEIKKWVNGFLAEEK